MTPTSKPQIADRVQALQNLCSAYPYKQKCKKLTEAEFDELVAFIEDNSELDHGQFMMKSRRWYLDAPSKPKNLFVMQELAEVCAIRAKNSEGIKKVICANGVAEVLKVKPDGFRTCGSCHGEGFEIRFGDEKMICQICRGRGFTRYTKKA